MDTIQDLLVVTGRIATIFPLMLVVALYMGKRSIGELPVFDYLVIIALGAVVGADIADPEIKHLPTAWAILLIGLLQRLVSTLAIKSRFFGKIISFEPTVIVHKGAFVMPNLKKARYSIDNILQMLREKDVFHPAEVELAVLEANGRLTVYKTEPKAAPAMEDLGLVKKESGLALPIIIEGTVVEETLAYLKKDEAWLAARLRAEGVSQIEVLFASVDDKGKLYIAPSPSAPPPVRH